MTGNKIFIGEVFFDLTIVKEEKSYISILKSILKENADKIIDEIKEKNTLYSFFEEIKENPKNLEKLVGKENSKKIINILGEEKKKKAIIKKEINLTTKKADGLVQIRFASEVANSAITALAGALLQFKQVN